MEGWLDKETTTGIVHRFQKRWFWVENYKLKYAEKKGRQKVPDKAILDLRLTKQILQKPNSLIFFVITAETKDGTYASPITPGHERTLSLKAPTQQDLNVWLSYLIAFVGLVTPDGVLSGKSIPIPTPMQRGLIECTNYLMKYGTTTPGVFRESGSSEKEEKLLATIMNHPPATTSASPPIPMPPHPPSAADIHNVANVLKRVLRELPESIFTDRLFESFVGGNALKSIGANMTPTAASGAAAAAASTPGAPPTHEELGKLLKSLPPENNAIVLKLIELFHSISVVNVATTSMDIKNMAICIGQSLNRKIDDGGSVMGVGLLNAYPLLNALVVEKDLVFFTGSRGNTVTVETGEGRDAKKVQVERPSVTLKPTWGHGTPVDTKAAKHARNKSMADHETAIDFGAGLAGAGQSDSPRKPVNANHQTDHASGTAGHAGPPQTPPPKSHNNPLQTPVAEPPAYDHKQHPQSTAAAAAPRSPDSEGGDVIVESGPTNAGVRTGGFGATMAGETSPSASTQHSSPQHATGTASPDAGVPPKHSNVPTGSPPAGGTAAGGHARKHSPNSMSGILDSTDFDASADLEDGTLEERTAAKLARQKAAAEKKASADAAAAAAASAAAAAPKPADDAANAAAAAVAAEAAAKKKAEDDRIAAAAAAEAAAITAALAAKLAADKAAEEERLNRQQTEDEARRLAIKKQTLQQLDAAKLGLASGSVKRTPPMKTKKAMNRAASGGEDDEDDIDLSMSEDFEDPILKPDFGAANRMKRGPLSTLTPISGSAAPTPVATIRELPTGTAPATRSTSITPTNEQPSANPTPTPPIATTIATAATTAVPASGITKSGSDDRSVSATNTGAVSDLHPSNTNATDDLTTGSQTSETGSRTGAVVGIAPTSGAPPVTAIKKSPRAPAIAPAPAAAAPAENKPATTKPASNLAPEDGGSVLASLLTDNEPLTFDDDDDLGLHDMDDYGMDDDMKREKDQKKASVVAGVGIKKMETPNVPSLALAGLTAMAAASTPPGQPQTAPTIVATAPPPVVAVVPIPVTQPVANTSSDSGGLTVSSGSGNSSTVTTSQQSVTPATTSAPAPAAATAGITTPRDSGTSTATAAGLAAAVKKQRSPPRNPAAHKPHAAVAPLGASAANGVDTEPDFLSIDDKSFAMTDDENSADDLDELASRSTSKRKVEPVPKPAAKGVAAGAPTTAPAAVAPAPAPAAKPVDVAKAAAAAAAAAEFGIDPADAPTSGSDGTNTEKDGDAGAVMSLDELASALDAPSKKPAVAPAASVETTPSQPQRSRRTLTPSIVPTITNINAAEATAAADAEKAAKLKADEAERKRVADAATAASAAEAAAAATAAKAEAAAKQERDRQAKLQADRDAATDAMMKEQERQMKLLEEQQHRQQLLLDSHKTASDLKKPAAPPSLLGTRSGPPAGSIPPPAPKPKSDTAPPPAPIATAGSDDIAVSATVAAIVAASTPKPAAVATPSGAAPAAAFNFNAEENAAARAAFAADLQAKWAAAQAAERTESTKRLEQVTTERDAARTQLASEQQSVSKLTTQLKEQSVASQTAVSSAQSQSEQVAASLRAELDRAKAELSTAKRERDEWKSHAEQDATAFADAQSQLTASRAQYKSLSDTVTQQQASKSSAEQNQLVLAQHKYDTLQAEFDALNKRFEAYKVKTSATQSEHQSALAALTEQKDGVAKKLEAEQKKAVDAEAALARVKSQLQHTEQQLTELRAVVNRSPTPPVAADPSTPAASAPVAVSASTARRRQESDAIRDLHEKQLLSNYDKLQSEYQELEHKLSSTIASNGRLELQVRQKQQKMVYMKKAVESIERDHAAKVQTMSNQLRARQVTIDELQTIITQLQARRVVHSHHASMAQSLPTTPQGQYRSHSTPPNLIAFGFGGAAAAGAAPASTATVASGISLAAPTPKRVVKERVVAPGTVGTGATGSTPVAAPKTGASAKRRAKAAGAADEKTDAGGAIGVAGPNGSIAESSDELTTSGGAEVVAHAGAGGEDGDDPADDIVVPSMDQSEYGMDPIRTDYTSPLLSSTPSRLTNPLLYPSYAAAMDTPLLARPNAGAGAANGTALASALEDSKRKLREIEAKTRSGLEESRRRLLAIEHELQTQTPIVVPPAHGSGGSAVSLSVSVDTSGGTSAAASSASVGASAVTPKTRMRLSGAAPFNH